MAHQLGSGELMYAPAEALAAGPLVLRRWRPDDAEEAAQVVVESLDHLTPWMPWAAAYANDSFGEAITFIALSTAQWPTGVAYNYAITLDGRIIGSIGLMRRIGPGGLEIGYWLHPAHTGRGYATIAARALVDAAFALPDVAFIEILPDSKNLPSNAVPLRLGFVDRGTRPLENPAPCSDDGLAVVWRLDRPESPRRSEVDQPSTVWEDGGRQPLTELPTPDLPGPRGWVVPTTFPRSSRT